jgi:hypothetical protein
LREKIGWGLILGGAGLQVIEGFAHADAQLNNIQFSETAVGKLVSPVEGKLPFSLGWTLLLSGAAVLWLIPLIKR